MFAIVEWLDVEPPSVSIVPLSWLLSEEDRLWCYWSASTANENLIKKCCDPGRDWLKYLVRLLGKACWYTV
jgi:hypothetical protein